MDGILWIIVTLVALGVIVGLAMILLLVRRGKTKEMTGSTYFTFFIMGITYLALGISFSFIFSQDTEIFNFFTFMGIIFTAMGLSNIEKWKKK